MGILDAIAEDGVASNKHQNDNGHKSRDDDNSQCIHIIYMYMLLYDSLTLHLLTQLLVLVDELLQMSIVVADAPSLVNDDGNKHQHYQDDSNCESQGNDEGCIHVRNFLITGAKLQTDSETGVSLSEKFVSNSEKMQKMLILLQFCSRCLPIF